MRKHKTDVMIRMVELYGQYLTVKDEVDAAVEEVMKSSAFIRGPQVRLLEEELAEYVGVDHCITCGNGTDALLLTFAAMGIGRGDEVIVPSFTFGAVAESVALTGATPVFADVNPLTFNIDAQSVERLMSPRTQAIVPAHMFGQPCDMPRLRSIAQAGGVAIVEDNAQSFGAECRMGESAKAKTGSIGLAGCTSFFSTKVLGCYGDGGAVFTDNAELASKIRQLANHGQKPKYHYRSLGMNSRLDTLQAAVLRVKLRHLDEWIAARVRAAKRYDEALAGVAGIVLPMVSEGVTHVYHQYTLKMIPELRDGLREFLGSQGIETMVYYPALLNEQYAYREISRSDICMDGARQLPGSVVSLPICSHLEMRSQTKVVAAIKEFMSKGAGSRGM